MAQRHVTVGGPGMADLAKHLEDFRPKLDAAIRKAVLAAATPAPPGMVKVHLAATVSEALLEDEAALGAFLVRLVKRNLRNES